LKAITLCHVSFYFCDLEQKVTFMPLDTLYLASKLRHEGFEIDFRDYQVASMRYDDPQDTLHFASHFLRDAHDIVIVTCSNEALPVAIRGLDQFKELNPSKTVIFGGIGVAAVAREITRRFPRIDYVMAVDQGSKKAENSELLYVNLVRSLMNDARPSSRVIYPALQPEGVGMNDSSSEPLLPAYDLVKLYDYDEVVARSAWGCPFLCSYCDRHRGRTVTWRSFDRLFEELDFLAAHYQQKRIFFYDETFTLSRSRVKEFCNRVIKNNMSLSWTCTSRVDTIDEELLDLMAQAGCKMMFFGVESGSDSVLTRVKKGYDRQKAEQTLKLAGKYVYVATFFIWGFPFETMDDFHSTMDFVKQVQSWGGYPTLYAFSALPASTICNEVVPLLKFDEEWWRTNWPQHFPKSAKQQELADFIRKNHSVFPGFYTSDPLAQEKLRVVKELNLETHFPE
jgi:radical SAM superfamily enzyme YgiQ (UPF0313 family)